MAASWNFLRYRLRFCPRRRTAPTRGGRRELDNAQFFTCLGQRLIKALDQPTQDGSFTIAGYAVCVRWLLDSGPLVLSFAALEDYYQSRARTGSATRWLKRGSWRQRRRLRQRVARHAAPVCVPSLYRLQRDPVPCGNMKGMIAREVCRGLKDNIKLGARAVIREIEFIVRSLPAYPRRSRAVVAVPLLF